MPIATNSEDDAVPVFLLSDSIELLFDVVQTSPKLL
jgi:hypothetical protein